MKGERERDKGDREIRETWRERERERERQTELTYRVRERRVSSSLEKGLNYTCVAFWDSY